MLKIAASAASGIVAKAKAAGFNTLYVIAYSTAYGAYYKTSYANTIMEGDYGRNDFMGSLIAAAKTAGVKIIASFPATNIQSVWSANPTWRSKKKDLSDYTLPDFTPLSAWHPAFRAYYRGLLTDFLSRYQADGLEIWEGVVDMNWDMSADYNPEATKAFQAAYPGAALGGPYWKVFRAQGITDLHEILAEEAHKAGKTAHSVQTWTVGSTGNLFPAKDIADGCGYDFNGVMKIPAKLDVIVGEFMWQQWLNEYKSATIFNPDWSTKAAAAFKALVPTGVTPVFHFEISTFGNIITSNADFLKTLSVVIGTGMSFDIYDFHQLNQKGLLTAGLVPKL